jgi:hypothetical protein
MRGHSILLIDSEVSSFAGRLQEAIEKEGAESLFVRGPYSPANSARMNRYTLCAQGFRLA